MTAGALVKRFEELDYRPTAKGPAILRRRWVPAVDRHVVEILLCSATSI